MASELERAISPLGPEENFAKLFEQFMKETDISPYLAEKEDITLLRRRSRRPLSYEEIYGLFTRGMLLKEDGLIEESYYSFVKMLDGGRNMPRKARFLAYVNLADNAAQLAEAASYKDKKIEWFEKSHEWADKALESRVPELPQGVFYTAIQSGKSRCTHAQLVEEPLKKELLLKAYIDVESARDMIKPFSDAYLFAFHTTQHFIARAIPPLVDSAEEKKEWYKKWFDSAEGVLGLTNISQDTEIEAYYLHSAAQAAIFIGDKDPDFHGKRRWYLIASKYVDRGLTLRSDSHDPEFLPRKIALAAAITYRMANLSYTDEEEKYWLAKNIDYNETAANFNSDSRRIVQHLRLCIRAINVISDLDVENQARWLERKFDLNLKLKEVLNK